MELLKYYTESEKKAIKIKRERAQKVLQDIKKGQKNNVLHVDFKRGILKKVS